MAACPRSASGRPGCRPGRPSRPSSSCGTRLHGGEIDCEGGSSMGNPWSPWAPSFQRRVSDSTALPRAKPGAALEHRDSTMRRRSMSSIRIGPARVPSRESPEQAVELLVERGYTGLRDRLRGRLLDRLSVRREAREVAREAGIALSVHAPIAAFLGHAEREKKYRMAVGMLDHSAGIAAACWRRARRLPPRLPARAAAGGGARRRRRAARRSARPARGRRNAPCRSASRSWGACATSEPRRTCSAISAQLGWVRPVLDFAHLHATSDGAFTDVELFAEVLVAADRIQAPGAPFHIHFSDIAYANRNETKHLPYGEGTLRADPLRDALARFERPATVTQRVPGRGVESGDPLGRCSPSRRADRRHRRQARAAAARSRPPRPRARDHGRTERAPRARPARSPGSRSRPGRSAPRGAGALPPRHGPERPARARASSSSSRPRSGRAARRCRSPRARSAPPPRPCRGRAGSRRGAAGSRTVSRDPRAA